MLRWSDVECIVALHTARLDPYDGFRTHLVVMRASMPRQSMVRQVSPERPTPNHPRKHIHHNRQIHNLAGRQNDVCDITHPHLVGSLNREITHQIWIALKA